MPQMFKRGWEIAIIAKYYSRKIFFFYGTCIYIYILYTYTMYMHTHNICVHTQHTLTTCRHTHHTRFFFCTLQFPIWYKQQKKTSCRPWSLLLFFFFICHPAIHKAPKCCFREWFLWRGSFWPIYTCTLCRLYVLLEWELELLKSRVHLPIENVCVTSHWHAFFFLLFCTKISTC